MDKDQKKVIRALRNNGWKIEENRRHIMATSPNGATSIPISLSPSDWRARRNLLSTIKKQHGLVPGLHKIK